MEHFCDGTNCYILVLHKSRWEVVGVKDECTKHSGPAFTIQVLRLIILGNESTLAKVRQRSGLNCCNALNGTNA